MSEKVRFYALLGLLVASVALFWYANNAAGRVTVG
jgi:NADH:ubiquinone oxidoreductase subunit 5 (subunit L)/multisubunit Na+/H+ antiporter MnhA subunit